MIRPSDLSPIAAALRVETYRFIGVRPLETNPAAHAPCVLLAEPTILSLDIALTEALAMWPGCPDWELIGSDLEIRPVFDSRTILDRAPEDIMSPRGRVLERPARMAAFHLAAA